MSKQDRQGVRTPADLERKYQFGRTFAEIMGLVSDARDSISELETNVHNEIHTQATAILRNAEEILFTALENRVTTDELKNTESNLEAKLSLTADELSLSFESAITEEIEGVNEELTPIKEELSKHFVFSENGLVIKAGEGSASLLLNNDVISFYNGDINENDLTENRLGWWDGANFHTGNIFVDVDEIAQFGNYGFIPFEDNEVDGLDLVRVGG